MRSKDVAPFAIAVAVFILAAILVMPVWDSFVGNRRPVVDLQATVQAMQTQIATLSQEGR